MNFSTQLVITNSLQVALPIKMQDLHYSTSWVILNEVSNLGKDVNNHKFILKSLPVVNMLFLGLSLFAFVKPYRNIYSYSYSSSSSSSSYYYYYYYYCHCYCRYYYYYYKILNCDWFFMHLFVT